MKLPRIFFAIATCLAAAGAFSVRAQSSNAVTTKPVYVPDYSHANDPMPDGIFAWDAQTKTQDATNEQESARFTFSFTNVTAGNVTIISAPRPSCGCTTAEVPPIPWTIPPGASGEIKLNVNLQGKTSMAGKLFKFVDVTTDKGNKRLNFWINVLPPPPMPKMTDAQRAAGIAAAKVDRQAVFKGDCASCHLKKVDGKYGQQLYDLVCAVCHESEPRSTMVPDLHHLPVPTSEEFWRTWITLGKPGSLMPAFATSQGGPLTDLQIASLAAWMNSTIPSHIPPATK